MSAQGYLAHGLTARMAELDVMLEALEQVAAGPCDRLVSGALALVCDESEVLQLLYVLPGGQGDRIDDVIVVSPRAPVVQALAGAQAGDVRQVRRGDRLEWVEVLEVR